MLPAWKIKMLEAELEKWKQERDVKDNEAITRLAEYEDSGLSPEEVQELAKAKADGRLVVLPPPEESDYEGLKVKYRVYKAKDNTPVENCFVLRPEKDMAAVAALTAYAHATDNKQLAEDILNWITPDERVKVLPCKGGTVVYAHSSVAGYDSIISGIVQYFVVHEQFIDLFVLFKPNPNEDKHDFAEYIRADKIGKTVFLSREAAEKALGGAEG